ncbi:IPT/TIG domain-containing protein [Acidobacteriota bacterium]
MARNAFRHKIFFAFFLILIISTHPIFAEQTDCPSVTDETGYLKDQIAACNIPDGYIKVGGPDDRRPRLVFDTSSIPDDAYITDAYIYLYCTKSVSGIKVQVWDLNPAISCPDSYDDAGSGIRYSSSAGDTICSSVGNSYNVYFGMSAGKDAIKNSLSSNRLYCGIAPMPGYSGIDYAEFEDSTQRLYLRVFYTTDCTSSPFKAHNPNPTNGATGISLNQQLGWNNGGGATSYDIYLGTDSTPDSGEFRGNKSATNYNPGGLNSNTTYYWRIDAKNDCGTTTGDVWSFTTEESTTCTYSINPTQMQFDASSHSDSFNVTTQSGCTWTAIASHGWIHTSSNDTGNGVVNFSIDENTDQNQRSGTITVENQSFDIVQEGTGACPEPEKPINPDPYDNEWDVATDAVLSWSDGGGATSYDVYFGTNRNLEESDLKRNQTGTTYDPGLLNPYTRYYWRIDSVNECGKTEGDEWTFQIEANPYILSTVPRNGPVGTHVRIIGERFKSSEGTVTFNGVNADIISWSDTEIETEVPPGATTGPVVVRTNSGFESDAATFTVRDSGTHGWCRTVDIDVSRNILWAGNGETLQIYDISTPAFPEILGEVDLGDEVFDVTISGNYAYVTTWETLRIISISNLSRPKEIGIAGIPQFSYVNQGDEVLVKSGYAYVATEWGCLIYDVSDPYNPAFLKSFAGSTYNIAIHNNYLYATHEAGFYIFDITVPANPNQIGYYTGDMQDGEFNEIAFSNSGHVLASHELWGSNELESSGLTIVDVSNPANPTKVGYYTEANKLFKGVVVSGNHAYLFEFYNRELLILDFQSFSSPVKVGTCPASSYSFSEQDISGSLLAMAQYDHGFSIFDISDVENPFPVASDEPYISDIEPDTGSIGTEVTISGRNFGGTPGTVTFNGVDALIADEDWTETQILVTVPSGATSGPVVVHTRDDEESNEVFFSVSGHAPFSDISITHKNLVFYNGNSPFFPNEIFIYVYVKNKRSTRVENIEINFKIDGVVVDSKKIDYIDSGDEKGASGQLNPDHNIENSELTVTASSLSLEDSDPTDNTITIPLSFYSIGFRHDEDAFNFPNWNFDSWEDFSSSLHHFLQIQIEKFNIANTASILVDGMLFGILGSAYHCWGMADTSVAYYVWPDIKPDNKITTYQMTEAQAKPDIIERHWGQVLRAYPKFLDALISYKAKPEYDKIFNLIVNEKKPAIIALLGEMINDFGVKGKVIHTVVGYKILDLGPDDKRVFVYDNNHPLGKKGRDYEVTFHPISNSAEYHEDYDYQIAVTFAPHLTYSQREIEHFLSNCIESTCDSLESDGLFIYRTRSPVESLLFDQIGRRIGFLNGEYINEIPEAILEKHLDSEFFLLPNNQTYTVEITGTGDGKLGVDIVFPTSESSANVIVFNDISVSQGSKITTTINPDNYHFELNIDTGEIKEPDNAGEINAQDILEPTSVNTLIKNVENYYIMGWIRKKGTRNGLISKLKNVQKKIEKGQVNAAKNQLRAFINQVNSGKNVDERARGFLIDYAEHIISRL